MSIEKLKMNYRWCARVVCAVACMVAAPIAGLTAEPEREMLTIGGRIVDSMHKAVNGVEVRLFDESGNSIKTDRSSAAGSFALEHKACGKCMLEVIPDEKSGLATALFDSVPGDKDRKFIVELHHGFTISGRVMNEGKPLKGIVVKALPADLEDVHAHIHGGGFAITNRDGQFHMTLTPGHKKLRMFNDRYNGVIAEHETEIAVEAPAALPDIIMASLHQEDAK
jgi:hypothetical protein